jgi:hypothetical protein
VCVRELGGLLILVWQFDSEKGLDAGVQVEGFTGAAGTDGLSVGVVEPFTAAS